MKKIISTLISLIFLAGIIGLIASCVNCAGCSGCSGCSSCNKGDDHVDPPEPPTEYCYVYANDGTDKVYNVPTTTTSLSTDYTRREGYTFVGVFSSTVGGEQYFNADGQRTMTTNKDDQLYMRWEINVYKLVFMVDDRQVAEISGIAYGAVLPAFPVPEQIPEGKLFAGWMDVGKNTVVTNGQGVSVTETLGSRYTLTNSDKVITLKATFKDIAYKVTYDYGEYGALKSIEVAPGTTLTLPELDLSAKPDCEFLGWSYTDSLTAPRYYDGEPINNDTVLYAIVYKFKEISLKAEDRVLTTVRVYNNGVSVLLSSVEIELDAGYEIVGWYSSPSMGGSSKVTSIVYDSPYTEYYADVRPVTYTATFVLGAGETCSVSGVNYTVESSLSLPAAEKTNYEFIGWCTDEELESSPINEIAAGSTGNINLYPKFKGIDVKLNLNARNGSLADSVTHEYGAEYQLPVPRFEGYLFLGWFDEITEGEQFTDAQGKSLTGLSVATETTLYAHWAKKFYVNVTVTPQSAGEVQVEEYYIAEDTVSLAFPVPAGYELVGWFVGEELVGSEELYTFDMPAADVELTLKLEPKKYGVTLDCLDFEQDGEIVTVTFGEPFEFPVLEKPAYKFIGWYYNSVLLTDGNGHSVNAWDIAKNVTVMPQFAQIDESNGILIYDKETLLAVKNNTSATYQLVFNVDMEGEEWVPFTFNGKIIGNNYTIKNLTVSPSAAGITGVFTTLNGTVQDVVFENLNVAANVTDYTNEYALGGVCGVLKGTLSGVVVKSGSVTATTEYNYVGGLVGYMSSGTITNCKNYATVTSKSEKGAGGIVARMYGGAINNNANYGEVNGKYQVGGVIGYIELSGDYKMLSLSNAGAVNGDTQVGGVIGYIYDYRHTGYSTGYFTVTMTNFSNSGNVTGKVNVAGIIGRGYLLAEFSGSYNAKIKLVGSQFTNTGNISGEYQVGGLIGSAYANDGASTLTDCTSSATITGVKSTSGSCIGGLAGRLDYIKLVNCSNAGSEIVATSFKLDETTRLGYVGGYTGYGYAFDNCRNESNITYTAGGRYVGGITGYANNTLNNCTNSGIISAAESSYVGGLAGYVNLSGSYSFITLGNSGAVSGKERVGGIIGYLYDYRDTGYSTGKYTLTLTNLENSGEISGTVNVGGIIGRAFLNAEHSGSYTSLMKLTASRLTNTGDIKGDNLVGGLIGSAWSNDVNSTLTDSGSSARITANFYVGGLAGLIEYIAVNDCSNENTTIIANGFTLDGTTRFAYVGGYAGKGYSFSNCNNASDITYTEKGRCVGGITGWSVHTINNCANTGNIKSVDGSYVGGIAGYTELIGTATINGLTNDGEISGSDYVGGIIGSIYGYRHTGYGDGNYTLTLSYLTNNGAVSGQSFVGGTIGRVTVNAEHSGSHYSLFKITASFISNSGTVTAVSNAGGLMGYVTANNNSTIMEWTQTGAVTGTGENVDNLIGYKSNLSFIN